VWDAIVIQGGGQWGVVAPPPSPHHRRCRRGGRRLTKIYTIKIGDVTHLNIKWRAWLLALYEGRSGISWYFITNDRKNSTVLEYSLWMGCLLLLEISWSLIGAIEFVNEPKVDCRNKLQLFYQLV